MLGQSRPVPFDPYGRRRSRWRLPRWLVLLLTGTAIGAGGVVFVQERYLPPRLSAGDSASLRSAFQEADAARTRLTRELDETGKRLVVALADKKTLSDQLAAGRAGTERLRGDLASAIAALPPDPRATPVEVRAARFSTKSGMLSYDVVLTRERASDKPMPGVLQFIVAGESARSSTSTVAPQAFAVSIGAFEVVRGNLPLPDGFKPRQTTIQVLDRSGGKLLGMRVILVK